MPILRNVIEIVGWPRSVFGSKKGSSASYVFDPCSESGEKTGCDEPTWNDTLTIWDDSRCLVHGSMARNIQNTTIFCACKDKLIGKYKMWIQSVRLVP